MFKLPDGTIVSGSEWVEIGGVQYLLGQLSEEELAALGVEHYYVEPPLPPPPPLGPPTLDMGGSIHEVITGSKI